MGADESVAPAAAAVDLSPTATHPSAPVKKDGVYIAKQLLAGGISGSCAKTLSAPLDRTKILFQSKTHHYPAEDGVYRTLVNMIKKEGPLAFYKGNGLQVIRVFPYAAIQFTTFEAFNNFYGTLPLLDSNQTARRLCAGSTAGVLSVLATYPLDLARARFATQVDVKHYSGLWDCLTKIVKNEGGVSALYRGMAPTFWGIVPYAGLSFMAFETAKDTAKKLPFTRDVKQTYINMGSGAIAGIFSQTVTYPLDVLRRRQQLLGLSELNDRAAGVRVTRANTKQSSFGLRATFSVLLKMSREEGWMSLWRGLSINYLRVAPSMAASFTVYNFMRDLLGIPGGGEGGGGGGG